MWKYKFSCPFGGRGAMIFCLSLVGATLAFIALALTMGTNTIPMNEELAFMITLGIPPFTMLITFIVVNFPTKSDREQTANAQKPEWKPFVIEYSNFRYSETAYILIGMQSQTKEDLLNLAYCGITMAFSICFLLNEEEMVIQYICWGAILISLVGMFYLIFRYLYWRSTPKSLEYCAVDVGYSYLVPYFERYNPRRNSSILVYYLPSGKYRLYLKTEYPPSTVYFVRWHGLIKRLYWT